jgi:hypothetical protein
VDVITCSTPTGPAPNCVSKKYVLGGTGLVDISKGYQLEDGRYDDSTDSIVTAWRNPTAKTVVLYQIPLSGTGNPVLSSVSLDLSNPNPNQSSGENSTDLIQNRARIEFLKNQVTGDNTQQYTSVFVMDQKTSARYDFEFSTTFPAAKLTSTSIVADNNNYSFADMFPGIITSGSISSIYRHDGVFFLASRRVNSTAD